MVTFSAAATLLSSAFELRTRSDASTYLALSDGTADWIREAVRLSHNGELPNDSRYELIRDAAAAISDQHFTDIEEARSAVFELSTDLVPSYTSELLQWFSANTSRLCDCDDCLEQSGDRIFSVSAALELGYRSAAEDVLNTLITEIDENRSSLFDPETDSKLLLSDSHGVYIPQLFCDGMDKEDADRINVSHQDVLICQAGPEAEHYWEAWQAILDSAEIPELATLKEEESLWRLIQNGDLWAVRADAEIPEDWYQ
jgi:hypothetical protein